MPHHGEGVGAPGVDHYKRYIWSGPTGANTTNPAAAADRVFLFYLEVEYAMTLDRLINGVSFGRAGGRMMALYQDMAGVPDGGGLIVATAPTAPPAAAGRHEIVIANTVMAAGIYWEAQLWDNAADTFTMYGIQTCLNQGVGYEMRSYELAYPGPFTDPCPVTVARNSGPFMGARVLSIP